MIIDTLQTFTKQIYLCTLCKLQPKQLGLSLCADCFADMPIHQQFFFKDDIDPLLTDIYSACQYAFPVNDILLAYKYREDFELLPIIIDLYLTLPKPAPNTILVPVPSSKNRLQERGYDHILKITKKLAKAWHLPVLQAVSRTGQAKHQKGLNRKQRLANLQGQFELSLNTNDYDVNGCQLLIIDDVCTTGSTIAHMAKALAPLNLKTSAYVLMHKG